MDLPRGFESQGENKVCSLTKSLYGLKQAPRQWNAKLFEALLRFRFKQSENDHSLFIKQTSTSSVFVLIYVDDMLITGSSVQLIEETKAKLNQTFKMKDLGELRFFLGIEFARSSKGILMHQRKYALELISETGLGNAKPAVTPIDNNNKLSSRQYDDYFNSENVQEDPPADQSLYQRLIGKLLYLTMTRPDIAFGVQTLSQFLQQPKKTHMEAALRIVRYIKG